MIFIIYKGTYIHSIIIIRIYKTFFIIILIYIHTLYFLYILLLLTTSCSTIRMYIRMHIYNII